MAGRALDDDGFGASARHRRQLTVKCGAPRADDEEVAVSASEPISPELVLVCPELAAAARAALPDPVPFAPRRVATPPAWTCALAYAATRLADVALSALLWVLVLAVIATAPLLF